MKKQTINFSWPASLSGFNQDIAHENFTRGKLKVFYKGETADHRYFSDEFSEELVKSLPYTPVVSYYDEDKEDFVGHATEQQIYGMVDPTIEPTFEKSEDGIEWCVCDVVLYTERPDKVGDIAKKIVGHPQSLELDPSTVKYMVNYDDKKHFKNIEFTAGRFVGVSVLGKDQKPAFTGSEFFAYNEEFEKKMQILRNYCEGEDQINQGGEEMNLQEFMKLSWGDISLKVEETLNREYQEDAFVSIIDMYEDSVIARFFFYLEGKQKLMRVAYTCNSETGDVELGKVNEVHITYEDIENIPTSDYVETDIQQSVPSEEPCDEPCAAEVMSESVNADDLTAHENQDDVNEEVSECGCGDKEEEEKGSCEEQDGKEEGSCAVKESIEEDVKEDVEEPSNCEEQKEDDVPCEENCELAQVENVEITPNDEKVRVENEEQQQFNDERQENSSSTSFTDSERAEFEALKREKKLNLIQSYKDNLTHDQLDSFTSMVDEFEIKDLELELLKAYKATEETQQSRPMRAFALAHLNNNANKENNLDAFVRKNLR